MKDLKVLIQIKAKLPDELHIKIAKSKDGGYWVEIKELPGCYTQFENPKELFLMLNDAIFTYFDVPQKYIPYVGIYLPKEIFRRKVEKDNKFPSNSLQKKLELQRV